MLRHCVLQAAPCTEPTRFLANDSARWDGYRDDRKGRTGTGVSTALRQIVAEELDYPFEKISWIQGDTANTVDQAPTFGSQTIKRGGGQLRQAAAEAKATLLSLASARLGVPTEQLTVAQGVISDPGNPKESLLCQSHRRTASIVT